VRQTTCHQGCCSERPSLASGPGTSSSTSASSQRLNRSAGRLGVTAAAIRLAHLEGKGCRGKAPGRVFARTPVSPSSAPARLAVGFGPKEVKPYTSVQCPLAIHPKDLIGPEWFPRPPAPPGGSALQHSVVTRRYTPRTGGCQ
jgi:hypothetical protein